MKRLNGNCLVAVSVALALDAASALLTSCAIRQDETSKAKAAGSAQRTLAPRSPPPAALLTFYSVPFT